MSDASELIAQQILNGSINKKTWGGILYNVYVFGAKGDGVNDDTQSVQDAIDTAIFNNGTLVFFPPGTYKVTALSNTSTINFVGDNATFVGYAGTISEFGVQPDPLFNNVKDYGAKGDMVADDTNAFKQAIAAAKLTNGGIVFIPPGRYKVTDTLTIDSNVSIWGSGSDATNLDTQYATTNSISILSYQGAAGKTVFNIVGKVGGVSWKDFAISGENIAAIGIDIDRMRYSTFNNITIQLCTQTCLQLKVKAQDFANDNLFFNTFNRMGLFRAPTALLIDTATGGTSNVCFNTFTSTYCDYLGTGIQINNGDNNSFYSTVTFPRGGGAQYGIVFNGSPARGNYFYHVESSVLAVTGSTNAIFGFDRENSAARPTVQAGAKLFWSEDGNNVTAWNMASPIANVSIPLTGEVPTLGAAPSPTEFKMFRGDNGQQYSITLQGSPRYLQHWYSNSGGALVDYMDVTSFGIVNMLLGGNKITVGSSVPITGTWAVGDTMWNTVPGELGTAGSKYTILNWRCVAAGTPGTWVQNRTLTGN